MQARIMWSLLWRSVLLLPVGAVMGFVVVAFPLLAFLLPVLAAVLFANGFWMWGGALLGMMIPIVVVRRWLVRTVLSDYWSEGLL